MSVATNETAMRLADVTWPCPNNVAVPRDEVLHNAAYWHNWSRRNELTKLRDKVESELKRLNQQYAELRLLLDDPCPMI